MPTIVDWPTTKAFQSATFTIGVDVAEAGAGGFYTGTRTWRSSLADRLRGIMTLPPCLPSEAGEREGYITHLRSGRLWIRWGVPQRPIPLGTMRGTPTVTSTTAAGATSLPITTTAGATMLPGDYLGCGTNTLIMAGIPGATANGSGAMTLPLAMPLPVALTAGAALIWDTPKGLWEWDGDGIQVDYTSALQQGVALPIRQVIQA